MRTQMLTQLSRLTFWTMVRLGRPFGGIRPRRVYRWVGTRAYPSLQKSDFNWHFDRFGDELYLNPYFQIDRDIIAFGAYDEPIHRFLNTAVKPGDICFDIGANFGAVSIHLGRLAGKQGHVYAFEPNPNMLDRLKKHVAKNHLESIVSLNGIALSNANGNVTLLCPTTEERNHGTSSIANKSSPQLTQSFTVPTITLDNFVFDNHLSKIDLIKVDIQGAELMFLEGAKQTLRDLKPRMLLEVSPEDLSSIGASSHDLLNAIEALNYKIQELDEFGIGPEITSKDVPSNFSASNILCTPKS